MEKSSIRNKYKKENNNNEEKQKNNESTNNKKEDQKKEESSQSNDNPKKQLLNKLFAGIDKTKKKPDPNIDYMDEINNELKETVKDFKDNKEDDQISKMIKFLNMIKLCNTMNILKNDKAPAEIIPNLFLGSVGCSSNLEELQNNKITHIVCCASGMENKFPDKFKYYNVNLLDKETENLRVHLDGTYKFIDEALKNGGRVLIHCYAGVSRSASVLIAYLMKSQKMKFEDALNLLKSKRGKVNPNSGFVEQLKEYEKEIFA